MQWLGYAYKDILVIFQLLGYTASKFIGIKVISEIRAYQRIKYILLLICLAWFALLGFALTPAKFGVIWLFLNGLPLGMVWGLVFGVLEGRRYTEAMAAALSASFIVSSGVVKAIGLQLINLGVDPIWMPFFTAALFIPPLILSLRMLASVPPPTREDILSRMERIPMMRQDRLAFLKNYAPGLCLLLFMHLALTGYRDFRDQFAIDILNELGVGKPENLWLPELGVAVVILTLLGSFSLIRGHRKALLYVQVVMLAGLILTGTTTLLFVRPELLGPVPSILWFALTGLGLYAAYVPFHSILFDRIVACFRVNGNAGFMIYMADATGYLGTLFILIFKVFNPYQLSYLEFFIYLTYGLLVVGFICMTLSIVYFLYTPNKSKKNEYKC